MLGMKICFKLIAVILSCHITFSTRGDFPIAFELFVNLKSANCCCGLHLFDLGPEKLTKASGKTKIVFWADHHNVSLILYYNLLQNNCCY